MFRFFENPNFDFYGKRKIFFAISIIIMIITLIVSLAFGIKVDIKFKGGTIITYSYSGDIDSSAVENTIEDSLKQEVSVQESVDATDNKNIVVSLSSATDLSPDQQGELTQKLQEDFTDNDIKMLEVSSINPQTGNEFFLKCLVAVLFSFLILIVFIGIRFRKIGGWSAGVMAILALLHDAIMIFAVFVLCRFSLNDNFMAIILTILGYSLNDTIVIYDRVRENSKLMGSKTPTSVVVNKSINQTLQRSINTSLTTILSITVVLVVALIFGVDSIVTFALPLLIGMISGVYSSICVAGPLWVMWKQRKIKGKKPKSPAKI